ncbi:MAG: oxidoreductase [Deltaproteobacteria bacterium]|nr:oxidoreductase [Deltaproteobacteria bacterium]
MPEKVRYGLLIDYEYCTGCYACQIACAQEYGWPAGMSGMKVFEVVQSLPNDKAYLAYLPFPTELCILCAGRTKKGLEPACVKHCMAACMKYGKVEELAQEMGKKPRMVLWAPR